MQKVILTVGIIASGKSTWAKEEVRKNPYKIVRVNRDDLRNMMVNYVHSDDNEKLIIAARDFVITSSLKSGRDVIIDDTNLNRRIFDDICKLVQALHIDCMIMEKPFYVELEEAISRNAARIGTACIPEDAIRQMWKKSGGTQHKFYKGRVEVFNSQSQSAAAPEVPANDPSLPFAVICDLDGTLSLFNSIRKDGTIDVRHPGAHTRNPYDASTADEDSPNVPVLTVLSLLANAGHNIIFCSGREDCYRDKTENFLNKHVDFEYQLVMRQTKDSRKDSIIKEELYQRYVAGKYNVFLVLDDRTQVVNFWRSKGFPCWQVNPGDF